MRFLHAADFHLGASNQPEVYIKFALPKLIREARNQNINTVLVVGDIFDKPHPRQETKDHLLAQILAAPDILFVLAVGNHDYTTKARTYNSLVTFSLLQHYIPNIRVCCTGVHEIKDFNLVVLPDDWEQIQGAFISKTRELLEANPMKNTVAAWHGMLPGFDIKNPKVNTCEEHVEELLKAIGADYLALGDIHKQMRLHNRSYYPGALTQKTYACESGFITVKLDAKVCEVELHILDLPERVNLVIELEKDDDEHTIMQLVEQSVKQGNLVRLKFRLPMSQWAKLDKNRIKQGLSNSFLEVKLHNDPVAELRGRKNIKKVVQAKSFREELEILIDPESYSLNKDTLIETCLAFM